MRIRRALISVSDKGGVVDFARGLVALDVELISTGGTARLLERSGLRVTPVSALTGFPEILGGRVKTLHPAVFGGLLARREPAHLEELAAHRIGPIDLVAVTLYPFEETVAREGVTVGEAMEEIDIGGVSLLRAAAKNWQAVAVVSSPVQYAPVLEELRRGGLGDATRRRLAAEAFRRVTAYDAAIAAYFDGLEGGAGDLPPVLTLALDKTVDLRYGENPHQKAAFYRDLRTPGAPLANYVLLQGKALSFNNIADMDAAWALAGEFSTPAIAIIKHASPCGVGCDASLAEAYRKAKEGDPVSAFGGVVGCNRPVDAATAREIAALFTEVVIAPGYEAGALEVFRGKPNLRLVEVPGAASLPRWEVRSVAGGFLVQERDLLDLDGSALR
ncbi:MAG: bifunctional phosphoribosylaminoimidazolecarboxamide formyltransferase/IMP cyclohydrolase, partial [Armatimonadetes bacterium]|nr:bifunctional phosphoribosylaminoimidazolecarboxamide formyltransferase/IMP cyclohydrolase [Armatimonadota bacterium]